MRYLRRQQLARDRFRQGHPLNLKSMNIILHNINFRFYDIFLRDPNHSRENVESDHGVDRIDCYPDINTNIRIPK